MAFSDIEFGKRALGPMYQQQVPQPQDEHSWSGSEAEYQAGYPGNLGQSDQLADAIARRLQSQAPSQLQMPVGVPFQRPEGITAGQRLALAIVSVCMLIPLTAIVTSAFGGLSAFAGLLGLGIICAALLGINLVFNLKA